MSHTSTQGFYAIAMTVCMSEKSFYAVLSNTVSLLTPLFVSRSSISFTLYLVHRQTFLPNNLLLSIRAHE